MKTARRLIFTGLVLGAAAFAQEAHETTSVYYVVFLRPDPARKPLAKEEGERIQKAHMANIFKMAEDGYLAGAGPFENDPPPISGVFLMKAKSIDDARRIGGEDPTVREHRNTIDAHAWRAPAGIGDEYFRLHKEHPETPENMGAHPILLLTRGPAWNANDPKDRVVLLAEHQHYVDELRHAGKLSAAGPVEGDSSMIGIVVFHRIPLEEAQHLIGDDPAVKAGVLTVEAHRWWSSDHVFPW
jgi:uncharacterized protein YciI